jgi:predicted nucleic acid-binding Zn ribbon protein
LQDKWDIDEQQELKAEKKKSARIMMFFFMIFALCICVMIAVVWHYVVEFFSGLCGATDCD